VSDTSSVCVNLSRGVHQRKGDPHEREGDPHEREGDPHERKGDPRKGDPQSVINLSSIDHQSIAVSFNPYILR